MWKLLVIAAVAYCVSAQRGGGGGPPGRGDGHTDNMAANLTALWQKVHELEHSGSCSSRINLMLHGPGMMGGPGMHAKPADGRRPSSSEEEEGDAEEHHQGPGPHHHGHHHGSGEMGPGNMQRGQDGSVHVHLHMGGMMGMGQKDLYHTNPIPWAHKINKDHMHGVCRLEGQASGIIHLRQGFMNGPVEMDMAVSDLQAAEYTMFVHRYGSSDHHCANIGAVFSPPHGPPGSPGNPNRPQEPEMEEGRARRAFPRGGRAGGHNRPEQNEGVLGEMMAEESGHINGIFQFDQVTLVGMHSIFARSIAIHPAGDDGTGTPVGCCVVAHTDGSHWGDEEDPWLPGEQ